LLLAELIVSAFAKGDNTHSYRTHVIEACDAIAEFRETYYPAFTGNNHERPQS
jgi:hypothetical protein